MSKSLFLRRYYTEKRQSFSERICDDLCEVILQYLPLKDKLRLECVSKQFQSSVFQKQYELKINSRMLGGGPWDVKNILYKVLRDNNFDLKSVESLLKKCPKIRSIKLPLIGYDYHGFKSNNYNQFVQLIIKYCNHLIEFKCPLIEINDCTFNEFCEKFGSKIKFIKFIEIKEELFRLTAFPNLEKLVVNESQTNRLVKSISEMDFKKLKTFKTYHINERMFLKDVIDKFKTIRHLDSFSLYHSSDNWDNKVLKSVSKLENLIHLSINLFLVSNRELFNEFFKQIPENFPKLKSIDCCLGRYTDDSELRQLLFPLKQLKGFKRLKLRYDFDKYGNNGDIERKFPFSVFQGFSNITHFSLDYYSGSFVSQTFFKDIDIYLPNLHYLFIGPKMNITSEETTRVAIILSRLSKLESIKLHVKCESIGRQLIKELTEKCKRIRTIVVIVFIKSCGFQL